jgi:hypothetical protein
LTTTNAFCLDWLEEFEFYMTNNDTDGFRYFVCVCAVVMLRGIGLFFLEGKIS